jgi:XTP/dITP diphosphohydrolase
MRTSVLADSTRLLLASGNLGKLREYQALAAAHARLAGREAARALELALIPEFASLPAFDEPAPTFAENAAGKALHYSRLVAGKIIADDSGLVVPALGGRPGVQSARYGGAGATDAARVAKLLGELRELEKSDPVRAAREGRRARFVCVLALAEGGRLVALFSDKVEGVLLDAPRGDGGFGYDPIFFYPPLGKTFAELPREEKNRVSHRARAFAKLAAFILARTEPG